MRRKLGSLFLGTLPVAVAISTPARGDHTCSHTWLTMCCG